MICREHKPHKSLVGNLWALWTIYLILFATRDDDKEMLWNTKKQPCRHYRGKCFSKSHVADKRSVVVHLRHTVPQNRSVHRLNRRLERSRNVTKQVLSRQVIFSLVYSRKAFIS